MLPNDPVILLSVINTWLRDKYSSLEQLCDDNETDIEVIRKKLEEIDYFYNAEKNQFI